MQEHEAVSVLKEQKVPVYYTYKDRVFRLLFKEKKRLLELYNALNGTLYENEEELIVNTLENAIFIKMKNDISFIIDCNMCLYEHQSTYCPNMPLRGFLYFADLYKKHINNIDLSVGRLVKIPTPHYIVFYNGLEKDDEEFEQRLSDAFEDDKDGCIDVKVRVLNINIGHNKKLLEQCRSLYGYSYFVAEIRKNLINMELSHAVEAAMETCIERDILKEFLLEQKAEVRAMSIYEYNEEYVKKVLLEDGREEGIKIGKELAEESYRIDMAQRLVKSVETAMESFGVDLERACVGIGTTLEEYQKAKNEVDKR